MTARADSESSIPRHPISVVAERLGLSQDVLRVWERRYRAVAPGRGPSGQRLYSDADIARLALIQSATRAGRSISQVASFSTEALTALVEEDEAARERRPPAPDATPEVRETVEEALALARALDSTALDGALRRAASTMGVPVFIEAVAAPLLRRVGDEWHAGRVTIAQEHLLSSLLQDIVSESMRAFTARNHGPRVLVATLRGDRHALGAALVGAAAATEGWDVLYLGPDLPATEIADAATSGGVRLVALSIVYIDPHRSALDELRTLRSLLPPAVGIIAGGRGAAALASELAEIGVRVETNIQGLLAELRESRSAA